ncbi:MAG: hypothetical protein CM15mP127_07170 [Gammaproteobacteria bacterium]|nr:MAG: hypothetical protein CM15mP127_07170 [Gammaproteobacteria bacterium]
MDEVGPVVEVKSRRVGGATYQVPVEVSHLRRQALAMRWLVDAARKRNEKSMDQRLLENYLMRQLAREQLLKRKRMFTNGEANKAFSHLGFKKMSRSTELK